MKRVIFIILVLFFPLIIFAQEKPNDAKEQGKDNGQQTTETMNKSQTGKDFDTLPVIESLTLGFEFIHVINNSNEAYFTYKHNMVQLRMVVSF